MRKKFPIRFAPIKTHLKSIWHLNLSRIIINAIPVQVTRHEDPLQFSLQRKYTITFESPSKDKFTIGPATLDEIIAELKDRALVFIAPKALEGLSTVIAAFERERNVVLNKDVTTAGFYLINNEINACNTSHQPPSMTQLNDCISLLDTLHLKFKNKRIFPTIIRWTICAPFSFVMKQKNGAWLPWLYLWGFPGTGKTTIGDISCATWGHYLDSKYKMPFTNIDTVAKLGEALSKSTFPLVINETMLADDRMYYSNKNLLEMLKTSIEGTIARSKFVQKKFYSQIPSYCACVLTSNSPPPNDLGFRRRILTIPFTQNDLYNDKEKIEFQKLLNEVLKRDMPILGNFAVNYVMSNQNIILDGKASWKEISKIILSDMYRSANKEIPKWIDDIIEEEDQIQERKDDLYLALRGFLINKINEVCNRHYRIIHPDYEEHSIQFEDRLDFCLENKLIPFLNQNEKSEVIITSDLIQELRRNKIESFSNLVDVSKMIDGFEYGQKKIGGKNLRATYGPKNEFLTFIN